MSYEGMDVDLYYSSFSQGGKDCNYSLMVHSDTQAPVQLFFLGVDRLLGSHYDEYFIKYNSFMTGIADPSVFDHEQSKQAHAATQCVHVHLCMIVYAVWRKLFWRGFKFGS